MPKTCESCEAYKKEIYQEFDDDGNLVMDRFGRCIRFNYVFDKKDLDGGWDPSKRVCDYHRKPRENGKKKETYKDFPKAKHNTHFRDVKNGDNDAL